LIAAAPSAAARLLEGTPLPAGWTGKSWACHQLAESARGVYLFFTDADTAHAPGTVAAAVAHATRTRADLLSAWPRLITETWGEKLVIPMILLLGMTLYPHWLLTLLQRGAGRGKSLPSAMRRGLGAANGQFLFFTRRGYEQIGGHTAIRGHLVEDVALGRAIAEQMPAGLRLINCDALEFSTCRMYRSFSEVWEGFTKNVRSAFESSLGGFLVAGALQICLFLLPFVFLFTHPGSRSLVLAQVALIFTIRVVLAARFRTSWSSVILHPFGLLLALAIGLNSWRLTGRRGVVWKGRTYSDAPAD
jgi:chlorobactene glucosyltransferase